MRNQTPLEMILEKEKADNLKRHQKKMMEKCPSICHKKNYLGKTLISPGIYGCPECKNPQ